MIKPGLAALLHPTLTSDFLPHLELGESFFVKRADAVNVLAKLPNMKSLEQLLETWPFQVQAHLPKVADEASAIDVSTTDARKLFENGIALMFDHAERVSADLASWLEAIRQDLGFSSLTQSRCLLYATPDTKGTAMHFDQNANFVLQLHGKKKWWLARNNSVTNPLTRHTLGLPVDREMESYVAQPMPTKMPPDAQVVELTPGSLLFVPAGMWHATLAEGDALALNFTYHAPAWLDLLTSALRSRLALSTEWRATAHGVSAPLRRVAACEQFDKLIGDLVNDLPNWNAADILAATDCLDD
jgi:50S ribosomal protein L16 3-hydroxylase